MRNLNEPNNVEDQKLERENTVVPFDRSAQHGESLISKRLMEDLRAQWTNVQASFVDEPRRAVEDADKLVASAIQQIQEGFKGRRTTLEKQWSGGKEASTEDLRVALQHYRAFFDRLVSM